MPAITNSAQFKATVSPIYADSFDGLYKTNREFEKVFKRRDGLKRNSQPEPLFYGFGTAPDIGEGEPIPFDGAGELYTANYVYKRTGLAFAITESLVEDGDHIHIGQILSEHLGKSMLEAEEIRAANIINRAQNAAYPGGDGVALASAVHPGFGGLTFSNIITGTLSQSTLEQILQNIMSAVDPRGKRIGLKAEELVVPPSLAMQAKVLLKSSLRTGTANNDINPVSGYLSNDPVVMTRLTSTTQWQITTNAPRGLQFLDRRKLKRDMEGDFTTGSMQYKATARNIAGWTDPRGLYVGTGS